jgi:hypothetical protein
VFDHALRYNGRMKPALLLAVFAVLGMSGLRRPETKIGLFESHGDVGTVLHEGSVKHDAPKRLTRSPAAART